MFPTTVAVGEPDVSSNEIEIEAATGEVAELRPVIGKTPPCVSPPELTAATPDGCPTSDVATNVPESVVMFVQV
jgi:hypothetical protein